MDDELKSIIVTASFSLTLLIICLIGIFNNAFAENFANFILFPRRGMGSENALHLGKVLFMSFLPIIPFFFYPLFLRYKDVDKDKGDFFKAMFFVFTIGLVVGFYFMSSSSFKEFIVNDDQSWIKRFTTNFSNII